MNSHNRAALNSQKSGGADEPLAWRRPRPESMSEHTATSKVVASAAAVTTPRRRHHHTSISEGVKQQSRASAHPDAAHASGGAKKSQNAHLSVSGRRHKMPSGTTKVLIVF